MPALPRKPPQLGNGESYRQLAEARGESVGQIDPKIFPYVKHLLTTAASRLPMKPTRSQLAHLAGRSPGSSSFDAAMGVIAKHHLMVRVGNVLEITDNGLQMIDAARPAPTEPAQLRRTWLNNLPPYESQLLGVLFRNYPEGVGADRLAELAGKSTTSSSWDGALSSLKRNELIEEVGRRVYRATPTLFPDATA